MANKLSPFLGFTDSVHIRSELTNDFVYARYIVLYDHRGNEYRMDKKLILDFLNFHSDELVAIKKRKHTHLKWMNNEE
jgi:ribosomal protein S7